MGQAHRPVERLRVQHPDDTVAVHGVVVVPELDVDELVGAVAGQSAHDQLPQVLLQDLLADTEVSGALPDRDAVVGDQPGHEGKDAREPRLGAHAPAGPWGWPASTASRAARTAATASGGPTTVASEPAAQASETSWSSEPAATENSGSVQ